MHRVSSKMIVKYDCSAALPLNFGIRAIARFRLADSFGDGGHKSSAKIKGEAA